VNIDRSSLSLDSSSSSSSTSSRTSQQQPLLELASYRRSVETGRIEFGVLLQRRSRSTTTAGNNKGTEDAVAAAASAAAAAFSPWLSVGDLLVPTLRDPVLGCFPAVGGASCA
jgi:hypothetical protein